MDPTQTNPSHDRKRKIAQDERPEERDATTKKLATCKLATTNNGRDCIPETQLVAAENTNGKRSRSPSRSPTRSTSPLSRSPTRSTSPQRKSQRLNSVEERQLSPTRNTIKNCTSQV
jgi:hypothetical protein